MASRGLGDDDAVVPDDLGGVLRGRQQHEVGLVAGHVDDVLRAGLQGHLDAT